MNGNKATHIFSVTNELIEDSYAPGTSAYILALEGWRRGLTLRWYREASHELNGIRTDREELTGELFALSSADKTHYFCGTLGDKLTSEAVQISRNRKKIKELLIKNKISVPEGEYFAEGHSAEEIAAYARELGFPVSVKTDVKKPGKSSILNLKDEETLLIAVKRLRENFRDSGLILERFIPGKVYRLFVVDNKVAGAISKPETEVEEDAANPAVTDILEAGQQTHKDVSHSDYSKIYDRSSTIDNVPSAVKGLAMNIFEAVPGLTHGRVDIAEDENTFYVIGVNPELPVNMLYSDSGWSSDLPSEILDYYFPETKMANEKKANFYFELNTALTPLFNKTAASIKIMNAPLDYIYAKKFNVSGEVTDIRYHIWLRQQAYKLDLHGRLLNLSDGSIEVVVAAAEEDYIDKYKAVLQEKNEHAQVKQVKEHTCDLPLKTGFEIQDKEQKVKEKLEEMHEEIEKGEKDIKKAARQNLDYRKSISWRVTGPIRSTLDYIKNSRQLRKTPSKSK